MSANTPGPWSVIDGRIVSDTYNLAGAPIATVHVRVKDGMQSANACLISAAPELLDMLTLVHKSFGGGNVVTFSQADIEQIGAAIAKATRSAS